MKNALVYDLEINKAIPPAEDAERIEGVDYCDGWHDRGNMGISVIAAYDYAEERFRIFLEDNLKEFQELARIRFIVGFNSETFDDDVCAANAIAVATDYDLLRETYKAKGLDPYPEEYDKRYKGYGLNAMAAATLHTQKTGHGAQAPIDWQQGRKGSVIDYCLNDAMLTKKLFDRVLAGEPLVDPNKKFPIILQHPEKPQAQYLTYGQKVEALIKTRRSNGKRWLKRDIAEHIGRHKQTIMRYCQGEEPHDKNIREKIDQLYNQYVLDVKK